MLAVHTIGADDAVLHLAARTGFRAVVQLLEWRQVEPAPGEHYWEYPDFLVQACEHYGLSLVLRLDHPPDWALRPGESPPLDVAAYGAFVERVARRYRGRVRAYIIWNEPNLALEWNGQTPDPQGYAELLQVGTQAVRIGDPAALVVAAGLAPTNQNDREAVSDLSFLRALYPLGERPIWDAQAVHPYGFAHPPDAAADHDGLVFARLAVWRRILAEQGSPHLPLWVTEFGWTVGPASPQDAWQLVSPELQARYLASAVAMVRRALPSVEFLAVWNLAPALAADDPMSGYGLVAPDGQARPALVALNQQMPLRWSRLTRALSGLAKQLFANSDEVQVLALDAPVRLSDTATAYVHWAKPYGGTAPARSWEATFYLDAPGSNRWDLVMETMQLEERANFVYLNGERLAAIPVTGKTPFASVWTTVHLEVPPGMLRSGANRLRVELSPRLRTQQDVRYESVQLRNVRLIRR
ncbi:MAG: hypothetical protein HPY83_02715 [Anaerolineae bacterium]|nr:hypothetical protein [Anaerolineae bacterium]